MKTLRSFFMTIPNTSGGESNMPILITEHLTRRFKELTAVDDLNYIGESGAKSSVFSDLTAQANPQLSK